MALVPGNRWYADSKTSENDDPNVFDADPLSSSDIESLEELNGHVHYKRHGRYYYRPISTRHQVAVSSPYYGFSQQGGPLPQQQTPIFDFVTPEGGAPVAVSANSINNPPSYFNYAFTGGRRRHHRVSRKDVKKSWKHWLRLQQSGLYGAPPQWQDDVIQEPAVQSYAYVPAQSHGARRVVFQQAFPAQGATQSNPIEVETSVQTEQQPQQQQVPQQFVYQGAPRQVHQFVSVPSEHHDQWSFFDAPRSTGYKVKYPNHFRKHHHGRGVAVETVTDDGKLHHGFSKRDYYPAASFFQPQASFVQATPSFVQAGSFAQPQAAFVQPQVPFTEDTFYQQQQPYLSRRDLNRLQRQWKKSQKHTRHFYQFAVDPEDVGTGDFGYQGRDQVYGADVRPFVEDALNGGFF